MNVRSKFSKDHERHTHLQAENVRRQRGFVKAVKALGRRVLMQDQVYCFVLTVLDMDVASHLLHAGVVDLADDNVGHSQYNLFVQIFEHRKVSGEVKIYYFG